MNIIKVRQEQRAAHIGRIADSVEKALYKGKEIDFNQLVLAAMANLNLSRRTALDYIKIAFFNLGLNEKGKPMKKGTQKSL